MPALLDRSWPWSPHPAGKDDVFGLPHFDPATIAGISVAIVGNVLISFALNCQKLAHRRLELQRELEDDTIVGEDADGQQYPPGDSLLLEPTREESEPLLSRPHSMYNGESPHPAKRPQWYSRLAFWQKRDTWDETQPEHIAVPVDVVTTRPKSPPRENSGRSTKSGHTNESDYLKSKLWWTGFTLMNIGEIGNFISYGFAPASVVAPLGTFALVANCIFAPLMLKERFRKRDFLGVMIAIVGAVTVVLSANPSDTKFDPPALLHALAQKPFIVYAAIYVVGAVVLSGLSEGQAGEKYVFVDVGLCAIFGGFTVLSTKAFSSLLTREGFEVFAQWITYPILAVLVGTGVGQIRYLNRALMRFDSKIVVPAQFVTFNLSAILGSAILYQDFKRASFHQIVTFLYGCGATFVGVFLIAWAHGEQDNGSQAEGTSDDVEAETIHGDDDVLAHDLQAGALGRRPRATLVIPENALESSAGTPILRNRRSVVSMIGFSPAQRLLLVHSSPREERGGFPLGFDGEAALDGATRRRTMSLAGASEVGSPTRHRDRRQAASTVASRQNSRSRSSARVAQNTS